MTKSLFYNKVAVLRLFIKKETPIKVFPVNVAKLFKNIFFTEHFWVTASTHLVIQFVLKFHFLYGVITA